jgi:hypothetical protein
MHSQLSATVASRTRPIKLRSACNQCCASKVRLSTPRCIQDSGADEARRSNVAATGPGASDARTSAHRASTWSQEWAKSRASGPRSDGYQTRTVSSRPPRAILRHMHPKQRVRPKQACHQHQHQHHQHQQRRQSRRPCLLSSTSPHTTRHGSGRPPATYSFHRPAVRRT